MKISEINPFLRFIGLDETQSVAGSESRIILDNRIIYVSRDKLSGIINGEQICFGADSLIYLPAGTSLSISHTRAYFICFDFTSEHCDKDKLIFSVGESSFKPEMIIEKKEFSDATALNKPIYIKNARMYHKHIKTALSDTLAFEGYWQEKSATILKYIIYCIVESDTFLDNSYDRRVAEITQFIRKNYYLDINNDDICRGTGYHPYYLNALFKKQTGKTIHSYLEETRIRNSKRYLISTELSIREIAEKCGFNSQTLFSNSFKRATGIRPLRYRRDNTYY